MRDTLRRPQGCVEGFVSPTLMIMLALASMASLLAMRNLWVNEHMLNAEADQLRTLHKAHAVLPLALADITGTSTHLRHTADLDIPNDVLFPTTLAQYNTLRQHLAPDLCRAGICVPNALNTNTSKASNWKTQTATALAVTAANTPYGDNTAWYWVEVFPQTNSSDDPASFIYRITVLATGVMPGSTTVLQAIWQRTTPISTTGQWHSWHTLHD